MCILLIEDDQLIRDLLVEELTFEGFKVCDTETADQAAPLIEKPSVDFALLVTDIHMPGQLNGINAAHLMRQHHPSVPIIYMTGRPDVLKALGPLGPQEALLAKPFTPAALLHLVRHLLNR